MNQTQTFVPGGWVPLAIKLVVAGAMIPVLGVPMTRLWQLAVLLTAWLALACSDLRLTRQRLGVAGSVLAVAAVIVAALPRLDIEEGHNIFLVTQGGSPLQDGLPPAVYERWRTLFEQRYPPDQDASAIWRRTPPVTLYASSSDALWRPATYSRRADRIAFSSLAELRGGFANDLRYSFYGGDAISLTRGFRADLPFFVMYKFTERAVGSTLNWRGTMFWEASGDRFEELHHDQEAGRTIQPDDVGRKAYALHLPAPIGARPWEQPSEVSPQSLTVRLQPSAGMTAMRVAGGLISIVAILAVLALLARPRLRAAAPALLLVGMASTMTWAVIHFSAGKYLGATYPPHGAGDDGLTHESLGRTMALTFMQGDLAGGLRGEQDVYWDTPGMRYLRFVEKILFGDTNLGYTALAVLLPWFVFLLVRRAAGAGWAWVATLVFLLCPTGSLSYVQYLQNAKLGYAEAAGFGFFVLGLYLMIRSLPGWGGGGWNALAAFLGGACLAGAMFLRPNLALAVPFFGVLFVARSWRARERWTMVAGAAGLALALWMPFHNYVYGHRFVLISDAGATISVPIGPTTYARAAGELLAGNGGAEQVEIARKQIAGWLGAQPRLPVAWLQPLAPVLLVARLATLAITVFAAFAYLRRGGVLPALAWTSLAVHLPMLFVFASAQFRYAMIGWDLCAIVAFIVLAEWLPPGHRRRNSTGQPA